MIHSWSCTLVRVLTHATAGVAAGTDRQHGAGSTTIYAEDGLTARMQRLAVGTMSPRQLCRPVHLTPPTDLQAKLLPLLCLGQFSVAHNAH